MSPRRPILFVAGLLVLVMSTGCLAGDGDASPSLATSTASVAAASPDATSAGLPPSAPPASGEPFSCDLPIVEGGTVPIANIVDVRTGTHDGYDRVVFEFDQGTPEITLDRAQPPFTQDASGLPIDVSGQSFLGLAMRGGTKQTDEGTSSYDGPVDFDAVGPAVVDLVEAGDFERQSTWYLGLAHEACVRLDILDEPPRVVIDVAHP